MSCKLADLRASELRWQQRALGAEDEDTAPECLRRRKVCSEQAANLEQALDRHKTLEIRLARQLEAAGPRMDQFVHQRQL